MSHNTTLNTNSRSELPRNLAPEIDASPVSDLKEEKEATQKTHEIAIHTINPIDTSPSDKITNEVIEITDKTDNLNAIQDVALSAGISKEADPFEMLQQVKEQHANELDKAKLKGDQKRVNYLTQMSILIGELTILLNDWSRQDNARIHEKKTRYRKGSTEIADNHKSQGYWKGLFGLVSVALSVTAPGLDGAFQNFANSFSQFQEANNVKPTQDNSLTLQELQKLGEAGHKELRDQADRVFQLIQQYYGAATR